jgi:hypothetical protein
MIRPQARNHFGLATRSRYELIEATYYTTCLYVTRPKRKNQTMEPLLPLLLGIDLAVQNST